MSKAIHSIDIWKFISCTLIVLLHCRPLSSHPLSDYFLTCFCRIAVPFFFIASSFFYFRSGKDIGAFVKRLLILYLCWFIIELPLTIPRFFVNNDNSFYYNSFLFIRGLLINSTFHASWFITALWQGVLIVWWLSKKISTKSLYLIGGFCFLLACSLSMYRELFSQTAIWPILRYIGIFLAPANSFIIAIPYCIMGKFFAEHQDYQVKYKGLYLTAGVLLACLEVWLCRDIGYMSDVYLSLFLISPCIFLIVLNWEIQINPSVSKYLRNCSILVYLLHLPILYLLTTYTSLPKGTPMILVCVFFCSMLLASLIIWASKKIPQLRYLY